MRLDFINPATLTPAQSTEGGAPLGIQNPVPFENVVPTFNLPDDGAKPEDKHSKNSQQRPEELEEGSESGSEPIPEMFQLVMPQDFRELFYLYLGQNEFDLLRVVKKFRLFNNIEKLKPYSGFYIKSSQSREMRTDSYQTTLFYHYNRPGERFTGNL